MDHFAGLDVSVKETSVWIVDDMGKIVREVKVASEPGALLLVMKNPAYHFKRIGLEAGPLADLTFSQTCRVCASMSPIPAIVPSARRRSYLRSRRGDHVLQSSSLEKNAHSTGGSLRKGSVSLA